MQFGNVCLSDLAASLERALGVRTSGLKRLPGRSHSINYKVETNVGAEFTVKLLPLRSREKLTRLVAHAESVRCPLVADLAVPPGRIKPEGAHVLCFRWMDGARRSFDELSGSEIADMLAAHRTLLGALKDDGQILPQYDLAAARDGLMACVSSGPADGVRRELEAMDPAWFRREPSRTVVIHGDLNPGNILFRGGKVSGFLDIEELRFGLPAEDLVRYVVSSAEHLRFYSFIRMKRVIRRFEVLVGAAGIPSEDWLLAIDGALLRKLQRHVRGPKVSLATRARLQFRFGLYKALRDVARGA